MLELFFFPPTLTYRPSSGRTQAPVLLVPTAVSSWRKADGAQNWLLASIYSGTTFYKTCADATLLPTRMLVRVGDLFCWSSSVSCIMSRRVRFTSCLIRVTVRATPVLHNQTSVNWPHACSSSQLCHVSIAAKAASLILRCTTVVARSRSVEF
jgi:hypothetical protein